MHGDAADAAAEIDADAPRKRRFVASGEKVDEPGARLAAVVKGVERLLREIGAAKLVMRQHRPERIALAKRPPLRLHAREQRLHPRFAHVDVDMRRLAQIKLPRAHGQTVQKFCGIEKFADQGLDRGRPFDLFLDNALAFGRAAENGLVTGFDKLPVDHQNISRIEAFPSARAENPSLFPVLAAPAPRGKPRPCRKAGPAPYPSARVSNRESRKGGDDRPALIHSRR